MTSDPEEDPGAPMTLGEFRALTKDMPDDTPIVHRFEEYYTPTTGAVIAEDLEWFGTGHKIHDLPVAIITGGVYDHVEGWARGVAPPGDNRFPRVNPR